MRKVAIIILAVLCFTAMGGGLSSAAFANETTIYTTALEDLHKDENFDEVNYPLVAGERTIDVIQVAEGSGGELFIYVYQPGGDNVTVSSINICQDSTEAAERHWNNYKLTLIDLEGAIGKYKVEEFVLRTTLLRYYDITSIYRKPFDDEVNAVVVNVGLHVAGATLPDGNTTNEIPYKIARCYMAVTLDGNVHYDEKHTEVVEITDKYVGSIRYYDGFMWIEVYTDSHYVAFSSNYDIDTLYEAEVFFVTEDYCKVHDSFTGDTWTYENPVSQTVELTYTDVASSDKFGILASKYEWNRIESAKDFLKENKDLSNEVKAAVEKQQWVLRFYESPFSLGGAYLTQTEYGTKVSNVTVLRLYFEMNGKVYNLGVIDNKNEGDLDPDNPEWDNFIDKTAAFWNKVEDFFNRVGNFFAKNWWILVVVGAFVVLGIFSIFFPVLRVVFKVLWIGIKWIFKILWYILSAPARLIILIVNKVRERKIE